jgi:hypothetical protein
VSVDVNPSADPFITCTFIHMPKTLFSDIYELHKSIANLPGRNPDRADPI